MEHPLLVLSTIDRPNSTSNDILCRGKRSIVVDSKVPNGRKLLEELIYAGDVVIDPYRPGPHKDVAGHDINYLVLLSGLLAVSYVY